MDEGSCEVDGQLLLGNLNVKPGTEVTVTCSSLTVDVSLGEVDVTFYGAEDTTATATIGGGNSVTFYPETVTFSAPADNENIVMVVVEGEPLSLGPGDTFEYVQIDIKPGSDSNSTNLASNGVIAVAILTTDFFDAASVNASSVIFADAFASHYEMEDVDGDGDLDLILHFRTEETNLRSIYEDLLTSPDDTRQLAGVSLTGTTLDGDDIVGADQMELFLRGQALRELLDELFGEA
jgi:hypothetical protein